MDHDLSDVFGPVIFRYTRADAIRDGVLVPLDAAITSEAGFKVPVAMTVAAWLDCVKWTDEDTTRKGVMQDETGRTWDVLTMAMNAAMSHRDAEQVPFSLIRVSRNGRGLLPVRAQLVLHIGPGDTIAPVITIMMPGED